ncbi:hypothetical protein PR003_g27840 [Phytophthora rubi]|uniref:Secreted protein n=1 Tax=Phytophthora rubi TaxID=129364 RepID=A0A6A4C4G5_9STRA|nr:hypothetical protein PR003_g27840 [Phytophthora rubi]
MPVVRWQEGCVHATLLVSWLRQVSAQSHDPHTRRYPAYSSSTSSCSQGFLFCCCSAKISGGSSQLPIIRWSVILGVVFRFPDEFFTLSRQNTFLPWLLSSYENPGSPRCIVMLCHKPLKRVLRTLRLAGFSYRC